MPLTEVEIRLSFVGGTGGCYLRCAYYNAVMRGDGFVRYEDVGPEPRDPIRERYIPVDDVVSLVNEVLNARFLDAADRYLDHSAMARREGDSMRIGFGTAADGGEWHLTFRAGTLTKTVRLHGRGIPSQLLRLRELVEDIAGPKAW